MAEEYWAATVATVDIMEAAAVGVTVTETEEVTAARMPGAGVGEGLEERAEEEHSYRNTISHPRLQ